MESIPLLLLHPLDWWSSSVSGIGETLNAVEVHDVI